MINKFENFVSEKLKTPFDFIHYSQMADSIILHQRQKEERNPSHTSHDALHQKDVRSNIILQDFFLSGK